MTLLIYRTQPSEGAVALAVALREAGVRAKKVSRLPRRLNRHRYVAWGSYIEGDIDALNNIRVIGKLTEIQKLVAAGVPTVTLGGYHEEASLYRNFNHVGGHDLLNPAVALTRPGFWVKKEEIAKEFRIHIWDGQSIRAGRKDKLSEDSHPWIRSYDGGWRIVYDGHGIKNKHREVAKNAVAALGLHFAAVDVAERPDGTVFVLEANRAPGLEGNSLSIYRDKIIEWAGGN